MNFVFTPIVGIFLLSGIISLFVAVQASRKRNTPGVYAFILWMTAASIWNLALALESASPGLNEKLIWSKLGYLGFLSAAPFFLLFSFEYSQHTRWLNRRNILWIISLLIISLVAVATNSWHHWIWKNVQPTFSAQNLLLYEREVGFFGIMAYAYFCMILGMLILVITYLEARQPYRQQMGLLVAACALPLAGSIIYGFGLFLPEFDLTPITYSLGGILLSINIGRYHLFDLLPLARHWLMEEMDDAMIVLDLKNRLVDLNPAAEHMLGTISRKTLGRPANKIFAKWPLLLEHSHDQERTQTEITLPGNPSKTFDVRTTPLINRKNKLIGRLIIFRDVTRRKANEETIARYDEEMGILDRINLAITSGLDLNHVLKTLHEQCSQVVLFDIFYVALYDKSSLAVNIPIYYENGKYLVGTSRHITEYPEIITKVMQSRKTMYLQHVPEHNTSSLIRFDSDTIRPAVSYVGIPLTVRDEVIGVMSIQSRVNNPYSDKEIRMLERIAIQAAIAIENARLYSEVQRLADIDELTGIYNYRGLQELGNREVERARRFNHPLTAIFIDVDDLRKFNNLYSHGTGNLVLQTIVNRCRMALRTVDIFARFGGDEFVVLLPETDYESACIIRDRLAQEISSAPIKTSYGNLMVEVSMGVNLLAKTMPGLAALIEGANQAEHQVKLQHKKRLAEQEKK